MSFKTNLHLESLARDGRLRLGIPSGLGGNGGDLAELFDAVVNTAETSPVAARIYAVQRHFAEVLLASENVGLAEYRLPYILDGQISGACSATWPEPALAPLQVSEAGNGWLANGTLQAVPNVGTGWYLVTALLQVDANRPPSLVLLSSEQDGTHRMPSMAASGDSDDYAQVQVRNVFLRGDEIVQGDVTQIAPHLQRLAQFLRCAIAAGTARRALLEMNTATRLQTNAKLARTINDLLHDMAARNLPDVAELRIACAQLERIHALTTTVLPSPPHTARAGLH